MTTASAPSASPGTTSGPERGAAAQDSSPMHGSRNETDALNPLSANHAIDPNTTAILNLSSHSPPPLSVDDSEVAIAGPSLREQNVGETADFSPDPSHYRYDIV